ncbi:MAG: metal ABC transporter substrate-binding protein [Eubacteriales bacterium]|nr:metal ABC transporter substrate-binding protein [Eubacteriales bacterium]
MKKIMALILTALFFISLQTGCVPDQEDVPAVKGEMSGKLKIVATLFPQYDFARQIAGDKAEVTLLLPPGVETHSYEPTPSDIMKINESDLFIFTGEYMEAWAQKIIEGMQASDSASAVLNVSRGIELVSTEEIGGEHHHDEEDTGHESDHGHQYDPHIWTDPLFAKVMAANIRDALCRADPVNELYYTENAARYSKELDALDAEFKSVVSSGKRDEIIFGSRFALYYFTQRYGLHYEAAFDSCSSETEPSAKTVAGLIEKIREEKIPVIYYAEIENPNVAESISAETGAKLLLFHSCHNVTKAELESGATYLSLMKQNAENLKEGLE